MRITRKDIVNALPQSMRHMAVRLIVKNPWKQHNHDHKLIIVHIPRTGGTSLSKAIFGMNFGHPYLEDFASHDFKATQNYLKVGVVRNPWDRLISAYFEVSDSEQEYLKKFWDPLGIGSVDDLFNAMSNPRMLRQVQKIVHFRSQIELMKHKSIKMDIVGRFEDLSTFMASVNSALGKNYELPHFNASKKQDYKGYYDEDRIELIRSVYRQDIDSFGYDFS